MPRFYFDMNETVDGEGQLLADLAEARRAAHTLLAASVRMAEVHAGQCKSWSCIVRDERNTTTLRMILALLAESPGQQEGFTRTFRPV